MELIDKRSINAILYGNNNDRSRVWLEDIKGPLTPWGVREGFLEEIELKLKPRTPKG